MSLDFTVANYIEQHNLVIKSLDEKAQNMEEVSTNIGTSFELTY